MSDDDRAEPGAHGRYAPEPDALPGEPRTGSGAPGRRTLRRVLISLGVLGLVLALVVGGGLWFLTDRYAGNIDRVADVFAGLDEDNRPAPATPATPVGEDPVTFLLVGS